MEGLILGILRYGTKFYPPPLYKWKGIKYLEYARGMVKLRFDQYINYFQILIMHLSYLTIVVSGEL